MRAAQHSVHAPLLLRSDLIDKMLARYASDHGMLRELLQNADDAKASEVEFRFTTTAAGRAEKAAASSSSAARAHKLAAGVIELREINNGIEFSEQDWVRVARIAEGNPSEDSVGMFGVGACIPWTA